MDSVQAAWVDVRSFRGALQQLAIWVFFLLFFFQLLHFDVASNWARSRPVVLLCQLDGGGRRGGGMGRVEGAAGVWVVWPGNSSSLVLTPL